MSFVVSAKDRRLGAVAFVAIATWIGYACAPEENSPGKSTVTAASGNRVLCEEQPRLPPAASREDIAAMLVRASCPGWMELMSDDRTLRDMKMPSSPANNSGDVYSATGRKTSKRVVFSPSESIRQVSVSRDLVSEPLLNDADDLLDGADDLLLAPTGGRVKPKAVDDELLREDDDLLEGVRETVPAGESVQTPAPDGPKPNSTQPASPFLPPRVPRAADKGSHSVGGSAGVEPRCEFLAKSMYPSAKDCRKCHEKIYDEWSISAHAYAMVSPMFHKFEQKINDLTQGTIGYFCYQCHSPAGVSLGILRDTPLWELPQVAREGVTCVSCHRVRERYGKVNGQRRLEPGDQFAPVYGPIGGDGIATVLAQKNRFKVKTSPHEKGPGQNIHQEGRLFEQLNRSEYCVSCHQVAVLPGIKLEVVWEQYRASPACKKGIQCQDCHMGRVPGVPSGYEYTAVAKVNDKTVHTQRKHGNHSFYGPGYSIAHPGIYPFNPDADRWDIREWLQFDYRAGWGTEKFEDAIDDGAIRIGFPKVWAEADDRMDAREILEDNQKKLAVKMELRRQVMENGSHTDGPFFDSQRLIGEDLRFHYVVTNTNEGHNLPSGSLGAQPQLWANVVLIGPRGRRLWESGYTDSNGDVADIHSHDVRHKLIPFDWQLFNLQTMFLISGAKGTDREFYLPINVDIDQLPFIRPGAQPISVINHPPFIRMEGQSIPATGSRRAPYRVPKHLLCEPGRYRLSFRMRSRMEPIYFMQYVGATTEMQRAMNEGILDFHESSVEFEVR